jgi:ActR/RegA family two-component response regulator
MYRALLIDQDTNHAERLAFRLRQRGLVVTIAESVSKAARHLEQRIPIYELVLVVAAGAPDQWLDALRSLVHASRQFGMFLGPLFLLISRSRCNPHLRLRIEHLGARYACER